MEWYNRHYDGSSSHILFSVSKSLTGAMTGILVEKGLLDPESPVTDYVPEVADSAYGNCTVRHVLDMTVSSSFTEEYVDLSGEYGRYRRATLWEPARDMSMFVKNIRWRFNGSKSRWSKAGRRASWGRTYSVQGSILIS